MATYGKRQVDVIIDVRSRLEYLFGHIQGARCIPLHRLESKIARLDGIGTKSSILLYCASGTRSKLAADLLHRLGYTRVIDGGPLQRMRIEARPGGKLLL